MKWRLRKPSTFNFNEETYVRIGRQWKKEDYNLAYHLDWNYGLHKKLTLELVPSLAFYKKPCNYKLDNDHIMLLEKYSQGKMLRIIGIHLELRNSRKFSFKPYDLVIWNLKHSNGQKMMQMGT